MISINAIRSEIQDIKTRIENEDLKPSVEKRLRNKIPVLNHYIHYVESNPSEDFIRSEIMKLETIINNKMSEFDASKYLNLNRRDFNKIKKEHEKMYGIPKLREQLNTLNYILNK